MGYLNEYIDINNRIGQVGINKKNEVMKIIECLPKSRVKVQFMDGNDCITETKYSTFLEGAVKNYNRIEYGYHGFLGKGEFETIYRTPDGKKYYREEYNTWVAMHRRAENYSGTKPTYKDVSISKEWWNYQNFAKWYNNNRYDVPNDKLRLDKDILVPGNKLYSEQTCCLIPDRINQIFKQYQPKADGLPTGVTREYNRYRIRISYYDEFGIIHHHRESFDNCDDAFNHYKVYKELFIHEMAEQYKSIIPYTVYLALKNYKYDKYNL